MRKEGRALRLVDGCRRLAVMDSELFLEGLRLHPHELCRAAETIGPVTEPLWAAVQVQLAEHRLWQVGEMLSGTDPPLEGFWNVVDTLEMHRELPQAILDFQEANRSREEAPLEEFLPTLARFLVRAKLEKMRFATYAAVRATP